MNTFELYKQLLNKGYHNSLIQKRLHIDGITDEEELKSLLELDRINVFKAVYGKSDLTKYVTLWEGEYITAEELVRREQINYSVDYILINA